MISALQNHIAAGYNNLGILYQGQGRYKLSLDNLLKSLEIRERVSLAVILNIEYYTVWLNDPLILCNNRKNNMRDTKCYLTSF